ncbi:MAG: hypothetical protein GAK43_02630 [Stenotrophomonas maltophilia]|nr:MAG: hypothetical protein GAK43_02630 [Stenotrophomonas maltophilia]
MQGFHCATCGEFHAELPSVFGSSAPAAWFALPARERGQRALLSSDQCIIDGTAFYVLGRLVIPVVDADEPFVWLTWVALSEADFSRASDLWDSPGRESEPPYTGRVANQLPYAEPTLELTATLHTQPLGERPLVQLEVQAHPLVAEQQAGISAAQARALAERALHG